MSRAKTKNTRTQSSRDSGVASKKYPRRKEDSTMARRPGPVPTHQKVIAIAETAKVPKVWGRWK
jgi:hypothetical protein